MQFLREYRDSRLVKSVVLVVSIAILGAAAYELLLPVMIAGAVIAASVSGIWLLCESRSFRRFCGFVFKKAGELLRCIFRLVALGLRSVLWRGRGRAEAAGS